MNDRKNEWKIRTYVGNQLSDESVASWKEYVENTGISKSAYKSIMSQADVNGTTKPTQDELGEYLVDALAAGEITEAQAQALWKSQWNKENSKTFDKWRGKEEPKSSEPKTSTTSSGAVAPAAVQDSKVTDYDGFRKAVPVYSEKKEAAYGAKPSGMTLDRYVQLLQKADTNSNDSITQDEMGFMLRDAVKSGEISFEEAEVIWRSQWNGARSKTLQSWAAKHP